MMKCPVCGAAELVRDVRDLPYTYKGRNTIIPMVSGDYCPACGEIVSDMDESERVMNAMQEFNRQVNGQLTGSGFIRSVRAKLNLNQYEAGELFGGGANAFSRYETGKAAPPKSLLMLFKVLDDNPGLLEQLRR